jgi:Tol biopolymer transport system component
MQGSIRWRPRLEFSLGPYSRRAFICVGVLSTISSAFVLAAGPAFATERIIFKKGNPLWAANANGERQEQLTESGVENFVGLADLSPDETTIVEQRHKSGTNGLYLLSLGTRESKLLYSGGFQPKFSPDGQKVIFSVGEHEEADIYQINIDGTGLTKLIGWKGNQSRPDFSADGTKILFEANTDSKGKKLTGGYYQIFVANANGTSPVQVTKNEGGLSKRTPHRANQQRRQSALSAP